MLLLDVCNKVDDKLKANNTSKYDTINKEGGTKVCLYIASYELKPLEGSND